MIDLNALLQAIPVVGPRLRPVPAITHDPLKAAMVPEDAEMLHGMINKAVDGIAGAVLGDGLLNSITPNFLKTYCTNVIIRTVANLATAANPEHCTITQLLDFVLKKSHDFVEIDESDPEYQTKMQGAVEKILLLAFPGGDADLPVPEIPYLKSKIWDTVIQIATPHLITYQNKYKTIVKSESEGREKIAQKEGGPALLQILDHITRDPNKLIKSSLDEKSIVSKLFKKLLEELGPEAELNPQVLKKAIHFARPILIATLANLFDQIPEGQNPITYSLESILSFLKTEFAVLNKIDDVNHRKNYLDSVLSVKLQNLKLDAASLNEQLMFGGEQIHKALVSFGVKFILQLYQNVYLKCGTGADLVEHSKAKDVLNEKSLLEADAIFQELGGGIFKLITDLMKSDAPAIDVKGLLKGVLSPKIGDDEAADVGALVNNGVLKFLEDTEFKAYVSVYFETILFNVFSRLAAKENSRLSEDLLGLGLTRIVKILGDNLDLEALRTKYTLWKDEVDAKQKQILETEIYSLLNPALEQILRETSLVWTAIPQPQMFRDQIHNMIKKTVLPKVFFEVCFDMLVANNPVMADENEQLRLLSDSFVPAVRKTIFTALSGNSPAVANAINGAVAENKLERDQIDHLAGSFNMLFGSIERYFQGPLNKLLHRVFYSVLNHLAEKNPVNPDPIQCLFTTLENRLKTLPANFIPLFINYTYGKATGKPELIIEEQRQQLFNILKPFLANLLSDLGFNQPQDLPIPRYVQGVVWNLLKGDTIPNVILNLLPVTLHETAIDRRVAPMADFLTAQLRPVIVNQLIQNSKVIVKAVNTNVLSELASPAVQDIMSVSLQNLIRTNEQGLAGPLDAILKLTFNRILSKLAEGCEDRNIQAYIAFKLRTILMEINLPADFADQVAPNPKNMPEIKAILSPVVEQLLAELGFENAVDLPLPKDLQEPVWNMLKGGMLAEQILELYTNHTDVTQIVDEFTHDHTEIPLNQLLSKVVEKGEQFLATAAAAPLAPSDVSTQFLIPTLLNDVNGLVSTILKNVLTGIEAQRLNDPDYLYNLVLEVMKLMTTFLEKKGNKTLDAADCQVLFTKVLQLLGFNSAADLKFLPEIARAPVWEQLTKPENAQMIFKMGFENLFTKDKVGGILITIMGAVNSALTPKPSVAAKPQPPLPPLDGDGPAVLTNLVKAIAHQFPGTGFSPIVGLLAKFNALGATAIETQLRQVLRGIDVKTEIESVLASLPAKLEEPAAVPGPAPTKEKFVEDTKSAWAKIKSMIISGIKSSWLGLIFHIVFFPVEWIILKWLEWRFVNRYAGPIYSGVTENAEKVIVDSLKEVKSRLVP